MEDLLYKGHFKGLDIAFAYTVATRAVNEAVVRHNCNPAAAHILGRAMAGALLTAALQPEGRRVNLCWRYRGALRTVLVDAGRDGSVRGFISPPQLDRFGDDAAQLYGEIGDLQVVSSEGGRIMNSGTAQIPLHDIIRDLAHFFCISDQIETGMSAMIGFRSDPAIPVQLCQGWMIQALPGADLKRFDRLRQRMEADDFRSLLCRTNDADGYFEDIARPLISGEPDFDGMQLEVCPAPHFGCTCSRSKMTEVVRSIPIPERMELVKLKGPVGVRCQFCNERYELSIEECIAAWNKKPQS